MVTRVAYSRDLNAGKLAALTEQAARLSRVRSEVWQRYGSVAGSGLTGRQARDEWMAAGHTRFGVLANAWKETVRDAMADSDGDRHGPGLGVLLAAESDRVKVKNRRRAKIRAIAAKAAQRGNQAKADRITRCNLGIAKKTRTRRRFNAKARTVTFEAVHAVVGKARTVVAEDLTRPFAGRRKGRDMNRRLAAWTKGLTAEALSSVSERRGSALVLVNAAYTSQADPVTGTLGVRRGDRLYCASGDVWDADHAAAINILARAGDPDITLFTPHTRVRQILQERADRHRTRLPVQDSSPPKARGRRAKHPPTLDKEQ